MAFAPFGVLAEGEVVLSGRLLYGAPSGGPPPPAVNMVNTRNLNFMQNIERLHLDVEQILAAHRRVMPIADLGKAVGRAD
jgi:hypothetical protein